MVDLRYADFTSPEVEIHTYSIMGAQTILVPPEINVDLRGVGVMGTFDHLDDSGKGLPGAPQVKVRGFSLWGKVAVKRKKRKNRLTFSLQTQIGRPPLEPARFVEISDWLDSEPPADPSPPPPRPIFLRASPPSRECRCQHPRRRSATRRESYCHRQDAQLVWP